MYMPGNQNGGNRSEARKFVDSRHESAQQGVVFPTDE